MWPKQLTTEVWQREVEIAKRYLMEQVTEIVRERWNEYVAIHYLRPFDKYECGYFFWSIEKEISAATGADVKTEFDVVSPGYFVLTIKATKGTTTLIFEIDLEGW